MKESTREIILQTSLKLFNERGVNGITLRQIASESEMSQGNLNYHFKKKEDILKELFNQFSIILTNEFTEVSKLGPNFYFIFELARKTIVIQMQYRFLIVDLNYLIQDLPQIEAAVKDSMLLRINQFKQLFKGFVDKGFMRKPEYKTEYEELANRLYILGVYSILPLVKEYDLNESKTIKKYLSIILSACYPYLTKVGKTTYTITAQDYGMNI
ncbi:TetR/AcrR family transcriptional regulator [uncultured Cytophaga sp.]|uniref:TetR/AcrR family transcriptional regulator n=1 Tax=uncultured Cytophaga sp. TaxID=160238 RepID=UPI002614AB44|nr:TetR/AcrR family transcriptional regulator [uncultured Cytophaga sp.]